MAHLEFPGGLVRIQHGHYQAWVQFLAQECPHATGAPKKKKKNGPHAQSNGTSSASTVFHIYPWRLGFHAIAFSCFSLHTRALPYSLFLASLILLPNEMSVLPGCDHCRLLSLFCTPSRADSQAAMAHLHLEATAGLSR